ncbi:condensation domain-containing protein [Chryseolinea lacunae]|uniref:Carrier domain-containing protein n=1 Tax=Chryseolinea lacunae TaxID=2801331 RepID=A0ABS1KPU9_9BACT|nr:condensation domain-containing protein [Chryseolinea lacunae]MBL0741379.1 hypothetical protein [Chryseolinea lacunae]
MTKTVVTQDINDVAPRQEGAPLSVQERVSPTASEDRFVSVWKEVFRRNDINVNDNFFSIGGDPMIAVEIASRLSQHGISVKISDILIYRTIEKIASHQEVETVKVPVKNKKKPSETRIAPMEKWFFEQHFENPHHYNQSFAFALKRPVDKAMLEEAFRKLLLYHDGLRVGYDESKGTTAVQPEHTMTNFALDEFVFEDHLSLVLEENIDQAATLSKWKGQFDLAKNILMKAAIVKVRHGGSYLLVTAHQLLMDNTSWQIFIKDLYSVYHSLEVGKRPRLLKGTASATTLHDEGSACVESAPDYWEVVHNTPFSIPLDFDTPDWRSGNACRVIGYLEAGPTKFLLGDAHQRYHTTVLVVLNVSLALTLSEWTGADTVVIEQEDSGRHICGMDFSRTIGWLSTLYPLRLALHGESLGQLIESLKAQVDSVPHCDLSYGLQHFQSHTDNESFERSEVRLKYLGALSSDFNNELFDFQPGGELGDVDKENHMTTKLEFLTMVIDGQLLVEIVYNAKAHECKTIERLRKGFFRNLNRVLHHLQTGRS